jgi:hypothetical protein
LKENYNQGINTGTSGTSSNYHPEFIGTQNIKNQLYKDIISFVSNNSHNNNGADVNQMASTLSKKHGSDMIVM